MGNLNKNSIPSALVHKTKLDLSCDHVTSQNFLQPNVVFYRHMLKSEKININALATFRLSPLAIPTYGRMRCNLRAFFVPYRLVFPQWDSFYTDVIGSNYGNSSLVTSGPQLSNSVIVQYFVDNGYIQAYSDQTTPYFDVVIAGTKYWLTWGGRRALHILHSLGYRWNWDDKDTTPYSALGLLAAVRVFVDWYANQQYLDDSDFLRVKQILAYNAPNSNYNFTKADLKVVLDMLYLVNYDTDGYFNSAWDSPMAPNAGQASSNFQFQDISVSAAKTFVDNAFGGYGTPIMQQTSASSTSLGTQYIHDALKRLTDYQKRHQLASAAEIDRYLAQFGKATESLTLNRSIYVGSSSMDIDVGDVMSHADTAAAGDPSNLGDYAGRGFGRGAKSWEFTADEFGVFLVFSSILPSCGMWQGCDRNNRHLSKTDYWVPEFDGLSVQSIERREVYVSNSSNFGSANDYNASFGFTGRYGEFKRPISWCTGDIECPSVMPGGHSWHLMRTFDDVSFTNSAANIGHSESFARGSDWRSFNRVFVDVSKLTLEDTLHDTDKFFAFYHFDVAAFSPCRPLFDTYDFEDEGKQIELISNGAKVN